MTNIFRSQNLYKLIICVFLIMALLKIRGQLITLNSYNNEISALNQKITELNSQNNTDEESSTQDDSRKNNEDTARRDLKMYYPNETPYKGY